MPEIIKISLVLSGKDNVFEFDRELPSTDFNGCRLDLFTKEINSLRAEVLKKRPDLKDYEEYIRIAAFDSQTGALLNKQE